jgi:hypothetical protein
MSISKVKKYFVYGGAKHTVTLPTEVANEHERVAKLLGLSTNAFYAHRLEKHINELFEMPEAWKHLPQISDYGVTREEMEKYRAHVKDGIFRFEPDPTPSDSDVFKVNLRLAEVPIDHDPIYKTLNWVSTNSEYSTSSFIKAIFLQLLNDNGLLTNEELVPNFRQVISSKRFWKPYNWSTLPEDLLFNQYGRRFVDLTWLREADRKFDKDFEVSIRLNKSPSDPLRLAIPQIAHSIWRTPRALFKLLIMSYLFERQIVDSYGALTYEWEKLAPSLLILKVE